jgi:acetyl esterase/lipase
MYDAGAGFDDPTISPARADLSGLPPLFVQWGTAEALAADACALAGRAAAAGVDVTADPWEGMWHVWQAAGDAFPEAGEAIARAGAFLAEQLPPAPGSRRRGRDMHG